MGNRNYECTPWGMPDLQHLRLAEALLSAAGRLRRNLQGTDGDDRSGKNTAPRAATPSARTAWCIADTKPRAVDHTFNSIGGIFAAAKATIFGTYEDEQALKLLNDGVKPVHAYNPLVNIDAPAEQETRA